MPASRFPAHSAMPIESAAGALRSVAVMCRVRLLATTIGFLRFVMSVRTAVARKSASVPTTPSESMSSLEIR